MNDVRFRAPWGRTLVIVSLLATGLCLSLAFSLGPWHKIPIVGRVLPLVILVGSAPFTIRGYTVTNDAILVHRLFWKTRLSREGLISATVEPDAMKCAMRTCGNGGLYSFTGWYWTKRIGAFRAYVTDLRRTVVVRFKTRKAVVVSPDDPEGFVQAVMGMAKVPLGE